MTRLACIPIGGAPGYRLLAVDRSYKFAVVGFVATLANFCAYIARIPSRIILEITSQKRCKEENGKNKKIEREFSHTFHPPFALNIFNNLDIMWKIIEKTCFLLIFYEATGKGLFYKWGILSIFERKRL
jgi:hypothetical protein